MTQLKGATPSMTEILRDDNSEPLAIADKIKYSRFDDTGEEKVDTKIIPGFPPGSKWVYSKHPWNRQ